MNDFPALTCLRSFEANSRLGSVTLAARELHVTHSAVSQQIKLLEVIARGELVQLGDVSALYASDSLPSPVRGKSINMWERACSRRRPGAYGGSSGVKRFKVWELACLL